jgi:hypothetical protein
MLWCAERSVTGESTGLLADDTWISNAGARVRSGAGRAGSCPDAGRRPADRRRLAECGAVTRLEAETRRCLSVRFQREFAQMLWHAEGSVTGELTGLLADDLWISRAGAAACGSSPCGIFVTRPRCIPQ